LKKLHGLATIFLFNAALVVLATACSGSDEPTQPGAAGSSSSGGSATSGGSSSSGGSATSGGSSSTTGDATKGATVWSTNACGSCHAETAAGAIGPNITFSKTAGIGNWTLAQFTAAVRSGKNIDGTELCGSMTRFAAISDASMADLYAYIQAKPISEKVERGSVCP